MIFEILSKRFPEKNCPKFFSSNDKIKTNQHFLLQFPYCSRPSSTDGSCLEYMEDSNEDQTSNKWNNYILNINGVKKNGGVAASVISSKELEEVNSPLSPPYVVAPSFEMRWPLNNFTTTKPAFQLTSHKQLELQGKISNFLISKRYLNMFLFSEEIMEDSDESPPYLPAVKPSAPHPDEEHVVEKPV